MNSNYDPLEKGCPRCNGTMSKIEKANSTTHEDPDDFLPKDEIWECDDCQTEYKIAYKPIVVETIPDSFGVTEYTGRLMELAGGVKIRIYDDFPEEKKAKVYIEPGQGIEKQGMFELDWKNIFTAIDVENDSKEIHY